MLGRRALSRLVGVSDRPRILVVDDEPSIVDVLGFALNKAGFETIVAMDGVNALRLALTASPDLILLDVMLPELDGLAVCRAVRTASDVPIILVTANGAEADRIVGLELHADDYVVKPFSTRELVARIRTVLRRTAPSDATKSPNEIDAATIIADAATIIAGALRLDERTYEATWSGEPIGLTRLQFDLLATLARRPRMVYAREQLLRVVWGTDFTDDVRTVDSMVKRLRTRLREAGAPEGLIASRRDLGYCLDLAVATPSN